MEQKLSPAMADRYGVGKGWGSRPALIIILSAMALILITGLAIVIPGLTGKDVALFNTGHKVLSDSEIRLTFSLYGEAGDTVTCRAHAVNDTFAEIGALEFDITLAEDREAHEMVLATSERAAAGQIESCSTK